MRNIQVKNERGNVRIEQVKGNNCILQISNNISGNNAAICLSKESLEFLVNSINSLMLNSCCDQQPH